MRLFIRFSIFLMVGILLLTGCEQAASNTPVKPVQPEKQPVVKGPEQVKPPEVLPPQPQAPNPQQPDQQPAVTQPIEEPKPQLTEEEMYQNEMKALKEQNAIYHGPRHSKQIALTFDDGPDTNFTNQVLDILKREQVPATFFVVGKMVKNYPDVLKRIDLEGHTIGNHSYSHPQLNKISQASAMKQLAETNQVIFQTIGKKPALMRPPYGAYNKELTNKTANSGMKVIYWDVDTLDWKHRTSSEIIHTVQSQGIGGTIVLQHSSGNKGLQESVNSLNQIIKHYKSQGYEFVTVDKMLDIPAYQQ